MDAATRSFVFIAVAFLVGDALLGAPIEHAAALCVAAGLVASAWLSQSLRRAVLMAYAPIVAALAAILWRVFDMANVAALSSSANHATALPAGTDLLLLADLVMLVGAALLAGDALSSSLLYVLFGSFIVDLFLCLSPGSLIGLLLRPRPNAWRPLFVVEIAGLLPIIFAALAERLASSRTVAVSIAHSAAPVAASTSSRANASVAASFSSRAASASVLAHSAEPASLSSPLSSAATAALSARAADSSPLSSHASVESVTCCITQEIMRDPVILVGDGHTYERAAISKARGQMQSVQSTTQK